MANTYDSAVLRELGAAADDYDRSDAVYGVADPGDAEQRKDYATELTLGDNQAVLAETMLMTQAVAELCEQGEPEKALEECQHYLAYIEQAEVELEGQHPQFSQVIQVWVESQLRQQGLKDSKSDILRAQIYSSLYNELYEDYEEAIEAGDVRAEAEWTVVAGIVEGRIYEHTVRDMEKTIRERYELAA